MSIEQIDFIAKQNEMSGSNYPSGYRQGGFFLPNESSQGVPVAITHPYVCNNIPQIPEAGLLTVEVTEVSSFFLQLGTITPVDNGISVVYPENGSPYLELAIPRGVSLIISDPGTQGNVIYSGEDMYGSPMVWSKAITNVDDEDTGRIPKKIFSAYVSITQFGVESNLIFNLSNSIELPFTDYGNLQIGASPSINSFSLAYSSSLDNPTPGLISSQGTDQLDFGFNFNYTTAVWSAPLTINDGRPRPAIATSWNNNSFTIWMTCFGFQNTEIIGEFIDPIAEEYVGSPNEEEYYVFGIPQYVDSNFTTWQG